MLNSLSSSQASPLDQLVAQYMALERRPVDTLRARKDELAVRSGLFNDLKAKLNEIKDLADDLASTTDSPFELHSVSTSDSELATATAGATASPGSYTLENIVLAKAHRVKATQQASDWTTGGAGTFSVNGARISVGAGETLEEVRDAINSASYASGRGVMATIVDRTLVLEAKSTGADYTVKVADLTGSLLSSVGLATSASTAVPISSATVSTEVSGREAAKLTDSTLGDGNAWQGAEAESSWTVTLDLGSSQSVSRLVWGRDQGGTSTDRTPEDYTLEYWDGSEWQTLKTVTDNTLAAGVAKTDTFYPVTTSKLRMTITATSDDQAPAVDEMAVYNDEGTFSNAALQTASDSTFSVNGISVTRSGNTSLTDVASGLTIDLKAAGGPVTLNVTDDKTAMRSKIDTFLQKLNSLGDYLQTKGSVTKNATGNYVRGALNGYSLYTGLRSTLASDLSRSVSGIASGDPSRLSEIGIEMDSSMHFVVKDSTKLNNALADPTHLKALLGGESGVGQRVVDRLEPYVTTSSVTKKSYLEMEQDAISSEQTSIDGRIKTLNERLAFKEKDYRDQFTRLQALMIQATQQQQNLQAIFSAASGWGL